MAGRPAIRRYEALVSVMDIYGALDPDRETVLAADALALIPELAPLEAAELLSGRPVSTTTSAGRRRRSCSSNAP